MFFRFVKEQLSCSHINQEYHNLLLYMFTACLYSGHIWIPCLYVIKNSCSSLLQVMPCQINTGRGSISWPYKSDFSVQVKMLICRTVLCVAYQIRTPFENFRSVQGRVGISIRTRVTSILLKQISGSGNLTVQNALSLKVSDIVRKTSIFITYI